MIDDLGAVVVAQNQGRFLNLEAGDALGVALDADRVDLVADLHGELDGVAVLVDGDEPARLDARRQLVEELALVAEERVLDVEAGEDERDDAAERGNVRDQLVRVARADRDQALARVQHALREPDCVQHLGLARLVLGQRAQDARDARVVGSEADQPQRHYSINREDAVVLLAVAAEYVDHSELRVREVQQRDAERDHLFHLVAALLDDVVLAAQDQVRAHLLAVAHERHPEHARLDFLVFEEVFDFRLGFVVRRFLFVVFLRELLEFLFLLFLLVVFADVVNLVQALLDVHDAARRRPGERVDERQGERLEAGSLGRLIVDGLDQFLQAVGLRLLAQAQDAQRQRDLQKVLVENRRFHHLRQN